LKAVVAIVLALLMAGCALGPRAEWEDYTTEGRTSVAAKRYARAESAFTRAVRAAEDLGPLELGRSLNNLGELNRQLAELTNGAQRRARQAEAENLFRRSIAVKEVGLGPESPEVATTLNNLARLYADQGRLGDALPLFERSLAIQEKHVGTEHPVLARTMRNLAAVYRATGRDHEAFVLETRAHLLHSEDGGDKDDTPPRRD
jgi:tetratricopeptide (TPR) repeat protein